MPFTFRVGQGYDVHRFAEERPLILGGVLVPYKLGLLGHSDADVLLHAIMDALIGAAGLGDIGRHFPDTDAKYKGISSLTLFSETIKLIENAGWKPVNIDSTVVAQQPKIFPYKDKMIINIAKEAGLEKSAVNVKATTEEGMGFTGRGEGIAAYAVCMITNILNKPLRKLRISRETRSEFSPAAKTVPEAAPPLLARFFAEASRLSWR